jgi:hypothetical protein
MMAALNKLSFTKCTVDKDTRKVNVGDKKFEVMLNPSELSHSHSISYSTSDAEKKKRKIPLGKTATEPKFDAYNQEKIDFVIVIDGTGVVDKKAPDVETQINQLKNIVYRYEGNQHEPSVVQISWGSVIESPKDFMFYGRLESMKIDYTLFKSSGQPLRAKVALAFVRYVSGTEESLFAERKSPDLTHNVEVKAGDTLPLLCYRIYKDCSYYIEVARINNIVNFRDLKPGTRLHFPPLR